MHSQRTANRAKIASDAGFSLIELMIAIAIFSIGIMSVVSLQVSAISGNAGARKIADELVMAESQLENFMAQPYNGADLDPTTNPHHEVAGAYTMDWNVTNIDFNEDMIPDDSNGDGIPDARRIDLTVTHTGNPNRTVTLQHIITP